MSEQLSAEPIGHFPGDDNLYYMDWTNLLRINDQVIATVDAVEIQDKEGNPLSGLDVDAGSLEPNVDEFNNHQGGPVLAGKAALFRLSGGTDGVQYYAAVTTTTDQGNTRTRRGLINCGIT